MKLEKPANENYCAIVCEIKNLIPFENCDNVVGTTLFGFQAVVPKCTKIGDIGIVFPAETQLSDEYCKNNDLYRHSELNLNKTEKGYIEDSRRVKAVKFRGNRSDCLFMPLESLNWTKVRVGNLVVGDEFDTLNGKEICKKYVVFVREPRNNKQHAPQFFHRVEPKYMPEHFDTDNFFKWSPKLDPETDIIVSQKIHGTSIRIGNTIVKRQLNFVEKLLSKIGFKIQDTDYDYIYASRKVIKDINSPYAQGFYDEHLTNSTITVILPVWIKVKLIGLLDFLKEKVASIFKK